MEELEGVDKLRDILQKKIIRAESKLRYYSDDLWYCKESWQRLGFSNLELKKPSKQKNENQIDMFG